jgi:hypothetical protein
MTYNSDFINLNNWRLTIPVDAKGNLSGIAHDIRELAGYENDAFFYDAPDGAMVFRTNVDGARTSSSTKYARTELRETMPDGTNAAWSLKEGGTMTATLKVDEVPVANDGTDGRLIVGQIHGAKDELVRIYYDNGQVYYMNEHTAEDGKEHRVYLTNKAGEQPNVDKGEVFSYKIVATSTSLTVEVMADGQTYSSTAGIHSFWDNDSFYFKAGVYLGVHAKSGDGWGQASFYGLDFGHADGEGLAGIVVPGQSLTTADMAVVEEFVSYEDATGKVRVDLLNETKNMGDAKGVSHEGVDNIKGSAYIDNIKGNHNDNHLEGGAGKDYLYGRDGDDVLKGGEGADKLYGDNGDDVLAGGAGRDMLFGGAGADIFVFDTVEDSTRKSRDEVADFEVGIDLIDLTALGFTGFDTDGSFTEAGELRIMYSENTDRTYIRSDQEGFEFYLKGDFQDSLNEDSFLF